MAHSLTSESCPAVATTPYLPLYLTAATKWSWASTFFFSFPKFKSQTLRLLSSEAEYRYLPVGCRARLRTQVSWPVKTVSWSPLEQLNRRMVLSRLPENRNRCFVVVVDGWALGFLVSYFMESSVIYFLNLLFSI